MKWNQYISGTALLVLSSFTNAAVIVDTGLIPCNSGHCLGSAFFANSDPEFKYAARFTLDSNTTVSDINVWINTTWGIGTSFSMVLYSGDAAASALVPDETTEFFAQDVLVIDKGFEDNAQNQWQGLTSLNLELDAGSYWLSLELRGDNDYNGYIPDWEYGSLNPVGAYAYFHPNNVVWLESQRKDFAFQVEGEASAVAVPATAYLFASGLIGFIRLRKLAQS